MLARSLFWTTPGVMPQTPPEMVTSPRLPSLTLVAWPLEFPRAAVWRTEVVAPSQYCKTPASITCVFPWLDAPQVRLATPPSAMKPACCEAVLMVPDVVMGFDGVQLMPAPQVMAERPPPPPPPVTMQSVRSKGTLSEQVTPEPMKFKTLRSASGTPSSWICP